MEAPDSLFSVLSDSLSRTLSMPVRSDALIAYSSLIDGL